MTKDSRSYNARLFLCKDPILSEQTFVQILYPVDFAELNLSSNISRVHIEKSADLLVAQCAACLNVFKELIPGKVSACSRVHFCNKTYKKLGIPRF